MSETKADQICRRVAALKSLRLQHEPAWSDCFRYTFPLRGSGLNASPALTAQSALDQRADLLDGTGTDSARILASAFVTGTTPPQSRWFEYSLPEPSNTEARWLDDFGKVVWENIHANDYDAPAFESSIDLTCAGWFVLYVDEGPEGGYRFEQWPIAQCLLSASKPGNKVDTIYREYQNSAEQVLEEFGEACSDDTKKLARDKPDEMITIIHAVYPRKGGNAEALYPQNWPFTSCKVEAKKKHLIVEGGYRTFPCITPRLSLIPASVYAVGIAFDALPDMRMLNTLCFDELANAELGIAGMWIAEDDGVINPRTVKVGPRKIIVANSVESMKQLKAGGDWQLAEYLVSAKQAQIRKVFMADHLQPADGPQMTAYEVHVRVWLIRQLLGPNYGRVQQEWPMALAERCADIALNAPGVIPPAPRSLANRNVKPKATSPWARAQQLEEVSAMDAFEDRLSLTVQTRPDAADNYEWDEATRERGRLLGVPAKLIRSEADVAMTRKERSDAQEAAENDAATREALTKAAPGVIERAVA